MWHKENFKIYRIGKTNIRLSPITRIMFSYYLIRDNMWVKIRSIILSIVDCSWKITPAKSRSTWFRLTSSWLRSYNWALRRPTPQNWRYLLKKKYFGLISILLELTRHSGRIWNLIQKYLKTSSSFWLKEASPPDLLITWATPNRSEDPSYIKKKIICKINQFRENFI